MKKLPVFLKRPLPLIAIIFLLASCNGSKEKKGGEQVLPPVTIDSVYDDVTQKVRPYEHGESVFYTMRLDSADIAALLGDPSFKEIVFAQTANSLQYARMYKLKGFSIDSAKSLPVNLQIDTSRLPRVFSDTSVVFGIFKVTRSRLIEMTTDKSGAKLAFTHILFFPERTGESIGYLTGGYNGPQILSLASVPGCCGNPSPPAPAATSPSCVCKIKQIPGR